MQRFYLGNNFWRRTCSDDGYCSATSLLSRAPTLPCRASSAAAFSAADILLTDATPYGLMALNMHFGSCRQRARRRAAALAGAASMAGVLGPRTVRWSRLAAAMGGAAARSRSTFSSKVEDSRYSEIV